MNDKDLNNKCLTDDSMEMVSGGVGNVSDLTDNNQGEIFIIPKDEPEYNKLIPANKDEKNKENSSISSNIIIRKK